MNTDLGDQQRGIGPLHDLQGDDGLRRCSSRSWSDCSSETTRKIFLIVDRLTAHMTASKVEAWAADASGSDRVVLPATVRPGAEPGRVPEQRHEGVDQRDWPAGESRGAAPRIQGFMIKLRHLPEHVRQYFQHPCVKYAAGT